jgi:predicted GNAT family N-acyltransferase
MSGVMGFQGTKFLRIKWGTPEYTKMLELRDEVLRRPLGRSIHQDDLEREKDFALFVLENDGNVIGSVYYMPKTPGVVWARQMAILPEMQGQGFGSFLWRNMEGEAVKDGAAEIYFHARDAALPFYSKLGCKVIGEGFEELGIPHHEMMKKLS